VKDRTEYGIGAEGQTLDWDLIAWGSIEESIRKLRRRIFRATCEQAWNQVRSLMKLMLRSRNNLLLAVRRVTQENQGRKTAGVDNRTALSSPAREALVRDMSAHAPWKAKPTRRIYIPKAGKPGQLRPLSIPTIANRVAQAIVKNALEPSWEARFEPNSYGFRPGRSVHDAIEHCWILLNSNSKRPWVLDADIKSAFDQISHEYILETIGPVPGHEFIKESLKAGYVEAEIFHATESGTPQGGIVSPVMLNIALNGLQQKLGSKKIGYVRYADDLICTARTRKEIKAVVPVIQDWLSKRGLALHPEKTRIVHVDDGFNFLGFFIKRYGGKCLIKPQKEKVLAFLKSIRRWLNKHRYATAEMVIQHLNPILRGWTNYYKHMVSGQVFSYVKDRIFRMLWSWCLYRHAKDQKGKRWILRKYFGIYGKPAWTFQSKWRSKDGTEYSIFLFDPESVRIERYVKVKGAASPDDPKLLAYWRERAEQRKARSRNRRLNARKGHAEA
jgi:RNA-directed DNA polymerase